MFPFLIFRNPTFKQTEYCDMGSGSNCLLWMCAQLSEMCRTSFRFSVPTPNQFVPFDLTSFIRPIAVIRSRARKVLSQKARSFIIRWLFLTQVCRVVQALKHWGNSFDLLQGDGKVVHPCFYRVLP